MYLNLPFKYIKWEITPKVIFLTEIYFYLLKNVSTCYHLYLYFSHNHVSYLEPLIKGRGKCGTRQERLINWYLRKKLFLCFPSFSSLRFVKSV